MLKTDTQIGRYTLTSDFRSDGAGKSVWTTARLNGEEYFIKKYLQPIFPSQPQFLGPEVAASYYQRCQIFETNRQNIDMTLGQAAASYGIVCTREFFRVEATYFRVTDLVDVLDTGGEEGSAGALSGLSPTERRNVVLGALSAVGYFHSRWLVHGDLKADNILVSRSEEGARANLIDFDDCYPLTSAPSPDLISGTMSHFSPELVAYINRATPTPPGTAADIFSLGLAIHELLVGTLPEAPDGHRTCASAIARGHVPPMPNLSAALGDVIRSMVQTEPQRRPSAHEVFGLISNLDDAAFEFESDSKAAEPSEAGRSEVVASPAVKREDGQVAPNAREDGPPTSKPEIGLVINLGRRNP